MGLVVKLAFERKTLRNTHILVDKVSLIHWQASLYSLVQLVIADVFSHLIHIDLLATVQATKGL